MWTLAREIRPCLIVYVSWCVYLERRKSRVIFFRRVDRFNGPPSVRSTAGWTWQRRHKGQDGTESAPTLASGRATGRPTKQWRHSLDFGAQELEFRLEDLANDAAQRRQAAALRRLDTVLLVDFDVLTVEVLNQTRFGVDYRVDFL